MKWVDGLMGRAYFLVGVALDNERDHWVVECGVIVLIVSRRCYLSALLMAS